MEKPSPATIGQLAASLGVGKSTVHRALTGGTGISPATRERILAAAAKAGYRRDAYFAALVAHRRHSGQTALPVHYLHGSPLPRRFGLGYNCFDDLRAVGATRGLDVQRVDIKEFDRWETMLRILYNRGSRGLLVEQVDPVMHDMIRNFGLLPVVCCERQHGLRFHTVRHAVADRVRLCWAKLREAGYRRIGFAHYEHPDLLIDDHDRLGAALTLLHKTPKRDHLPPLELSSIRTPEERNAYREWLSRHRPDAVIGFRAGLWLDGREHPNQPRAFVSLHTSPGNQDAGPVAGATHNTDVFAREAISLLDRSIRHGETGLPDFPVDVVIPPLWFDASGIPPAKG